MCHMRRICVRWYQLLLDLLELRGRNWLGNRCLRLNLQCHAVNALYTHTHTHTHIIYIYTYIYIYIILHIIYKNTQRHTDTHTHRHTQTHTHTHTCIRVNTSMVCLCVCVSVCVSGVDTNDTECTRRNKSENLGEEIFTFISTSFFEEKKTSLSFSLTFSSFILHMRWGSSFFASFVTFLSSPVRRYICNRRYICVCTYACMRISSESENLCIHTHTHTHTHTHIRICACMRISIVCMHQDFF